MIEVKRYTESDYDIWNDFNKKSKNPLFMFDRNYMSYHQDRFTDHSLLFYEEDRLLAILPMSEDGTVLNSHGGLTFGGFITDDKMKQHTMVDCFTALCEYAKSNGFTSMIYKAIPHVYHEQPAEEDRYALYLCKAGILKVEAATVVNLNNPLKMPKGRKAQISRARREGVVVQELTDVESFSKFIDLENEVLGKYHSAKAVHTGEELALLHERFPEQIKLLGAVYQEELIAGALLFEYGQVVHTQYLAANDEARTIGALDLVIHTAMEEYKGKKLWFDFGKSTEGDGTFLNEGLISQKEGFGGRTNVYETYEIQF